MRFVRTRVLRPAHVGCAPVSSARYVTAAMQGGVISLYQPILQDRALCGIDLFVKPWSRPVAYDCDRRGRGSVGMRAGAIQRATECPERCPRLIPRNRPLRRRPALSSAAGPPSKATGVDVQSSSVPPSADWLPGLLSVAIYYAWYYDPCNPRSENATDRAVLLNRSSGTATSYDSYKSRSSLKSITVVPRTKGESLVGDVPLRREGGGALVC